MNFGYVKVATYTPTIKVGDTTYNAQAVKEGIDVAEKAGVHLVAFPELCITGYTAGDLFYSQTLLDGAKTALKEIAEYTSGKNLISFVGLPFIKDALIYNVCAVISNGKVIGMVPKSYLPDYSEFHEKRYFASADDTLSHVRLYDGAVQDEAIPFGRNLIFADDKVDSFKIATELCEDLWTAVSPSVFHAITGARIIVNLSASPENSRKPESRRQLVKAHSEKIVSAYLYANAGRGESTTDCVFSGHTMIAEVGEIINENKPFNSGLCVADVDLSEIDARRAKVFNQNFGVNSKNYYFVNFSVDISDIKVDRTYDKTPFINVGEEDFLLNVQAEGLRKRLEHTNAKAVVLGLSGGLDSTLALIVAVRALKLLNRPLKDIVAVTMPCFATSSRTLDNSIKLARAYGVTLKKIDISKSVRRHLKDLNHSEAVHDAAYENAQARERTQLLMDLANMYGGLVLGTGDLSELALGWATYNGDHMSMYAVNASVPKTLARHLVGYTANNARGKLKAVLLDILDTPVSPELIPSNDNTIKQITEDIVGPYVLHDFFLYLMIKRGFSPKKIYFAAVNSFKSEFDKQTVLKWLKTFMRRFFSQQFKRSCLPDGVKVSEISLSPRGAFFMPSDAVAKIWLDELDNI